MHSSILVSLRQDVHGQAGMPQRYAHQTWLPLLHHGLPASSKILGLPLDRMLVTSLGHARLLALSASKQMSWGLLQAELQQQLADCTSTSWEGFHIMQLKIQALVSLL